MSGFVFGMEQQQPDPNSPFNGSLFVTKIAACCNPHERNILMKVSKRLNEACSKNNQVAILSHTPLILGAQDKIEFMMDYSAQGDAAIVANLLAAGANVNETDFIRQNPIR